MKILIVVGLCCAVIGCATANGPKYADFKNQLTKLDNYKSRITLYRTKKDSLSSGLSATIFLDNKKLGKCDYIGFCSFDISPGFHVLKVDDSGGAFGYCEADIEVSGNEEAYYKITPR